MRVHLVQFDIAWEDPEANFARVDELLAGADVRRGDLIVLPEMFDSGFSLNVDVTADTGRTLAFVRALAERLGVTVQGARTVGPEAAGATGAPGAKATNRAPVFAHAGELLCEYRKVHPFSFGREPERFEGGAEVMTYAWRRAPTVPRGATGTPTVPGGRASTDASDGTWPGESAPGAAAGATSLTICPAICYDLRFPELFRIGLQMGAEAFALGANWPQARQSHWRALAIARAIENQAFVFAVNRTGADPHLQYAGGSLVVGPKGDVLGELADEEQVLSAEVDPEAVQAWRQEFPAWRDLRLTELMAKARATPTPH